MPWNTYNSYDDITAGKDVSKEFYQMQGLQSLYPQYHGKVLRNSKDGSFALQNDKGMFYNNGRVLLKDGRMGTYDMKSGKILSIDKQADPLLKLQKLYGGNIRRAPNGDYYLKNKNGSFYLNGRGLNSATGKIQSYDMKTGRWIPERTAQPTNGNPEDSPKDSDTTANQNQTAVSNRNSVTQQPKWFDQYTNSKGQFNISRSDLEAWGNRFGDEATKNYIKGWAGKSDRDLWKDSNSGMSQVFKNFTGWVKDNGAQESKVVDMNPAMSNNNFTYNKSLNKWSFNDGNIGNVKTTTGTVNPYKPSPTDFVSPSNNSDIKDKLDAPLKDTKIKVNTPTQQFNFNRSQTRDFMRNKGLDPYYYSGEERKALRLYMNGDTTGAGYDINLLKSDLGKKLNLQFGDNKSTEDRTPYVSQHLLNNSLSTSNITKHQQGGQINMNEQQMQQAFLQYLMEQTGAQNEQQLQQIIQQMGEEGLKQAYAQFMQEVQQQQVQAAKFGAKLNYIRRLNGQCPEGQYMQYYKVGGRLCKKCMKARQDREEPEDPIEAFKCGRKVKKSIRMSGGGSFKQAFDKARQLKHRYFWYKGKTYNTYKGGNESREQWAKNFIDNSTSSGSNSVQTDVGYSGGWQGIKGANVGRYDSHGNWIRAKAPAKNAVIGARGDSVRNSDYKTFAPIDRPTDTIKVNGKGTDRGVKRTNKTKNYSIGGIPVGNPSNYNHYGVTPIVNFLPGGYESDGGTYVISPLTPQQN